MLFKHIGGSDNTNRWQDLVPFKLSNPKPKPEKAFFLVIIVAIKFLYKRRYIFYAL